MSRSADGSFVVAWVGGDDGDGPGILVQRHDAAGAELGTEFQINSYTTYDQGNVSISAAPDGNFVVVWNSYYQDGDNDGVFARRYDATGAPLGTEFQVNTYTTYSQISRSVASGADGRFVVVWQSSDQGGDEYGLIAQRYDSSGVPDGTEFHVNTYTTSIQDRAAASFVRDDGSFVIVWQGDDQDGSGYGIFGQRYDSTGAADGTEFQVNTYTTNDQAYPAVASTGAGSFVVVWSGTNGQDGSDNGIFAQRFDGTGAPLGTEFQVNSYTTDAQAYPRVASDADGGFVVVWESRFQDGSGDGVFGQRFDATGAADGVEFQVNTYTTDQQRSHSIASDGVGNFVVVWANLEIGSKGVFAQRLCTNADSSGGCEARCTSMPRSGCVGAIEAKLDYNEKNAGKEKMKLQWKKFSAPTTQEGFGDPLAGTTAVALCLYDDDDALVEELRVDRAGGTCAGKDCWVAKVDTGYSYRDKDNASDGVSKMSYTAGDAGKGKLDAKGRNNAAKAQADLPTGVVAKLTGNATPTIQVLTSDGFCVAATMSGVKTDDGTRYAAFLD